MNGNRVPNSLRDAFLMTEFIDRETRPIPRSKKRRGRHLAGSGFGCLFTRIVNTEYFHADLLVLPPPASSRALSEANRRSANARNLGCLNMDSTQTPTLRRNGKVSRRTAARGTQTMVNSEA
jgi:hypothetical protein